MFTSPSLTVSHQEYNAFLPVKHEECMKGNLTRLLGAFQEVNDVV